MTAQKWFGFEGIDGSGKSTVIDKCRSLLQDDFKVEVVVPCREVYGLFRQFAEENSDDGQGHYEDLLPSHFRHEFALRSYLSQLHQLENEGSHADLVLFDRTHFTWLAYQSPIPRYKEYYEVLRSNAECMFTSYFYIDVEPSVAAQRLRQDGDEMAIRFGDDLIAYLEGLQEAYRNLMVQWDAVISSSNSSPDLVAGECADRIRTSFR